MGYDYGFEYAFPEMMEGAAEGVIAGAAGLIIGIVLIVWLIAMAFAVVSYVLNAVGMYRIAKRRGIHNAWLAWVPVANVWLLGSISDHYQYVVKQKNTKRRSILLILNIILVVLSGVFTGGGVALALADGTANTNAAALGAAFTAIGYLGVMGLSIAVTVISYIAYYDLFRSCKPKNDVMFLVLSIIFSVTLPFFVFACSNSDEGMPARRKPQAPEQIPAQPAEPPVEEPWEAEIPVVEGEVVEDPE